GRRCERGLPPVDSAFQPCPPSVSSPVISPPTPEPQVVRSPTTDVSRFMCGPTWHEISVARRVLRHSDGRSIDGCERWFAPESQLQRLGWHRDNRAPLHDHVHQTRSRKESRCRSEPTTKPTRSTASRTLSPSSRPTPLSTTRTCNKLRDVYKQTS